MEKGDLDTALPAMTLDARDVGKKVQLCVDKFAASGTVPQMIREASFLSRVWCVHNAHTYRHTPAHAHKLHTLGHVRMTSSAHNAICLRTRTRSIFQKRQSLHVSDILRISVFRYLRTFLPELLNAAGVHDAARQQFINALAQSGECAPVAVCCFHLFHSSVRDDPFGDASKL